ncbi:MAG: 2-oxoglutarate dehydrogenase complex dihydrolipoyllysine-residue succinyltransferase [Verrucomicrobiota bacterium]
MAHEIKIPSVGESITSATLGTWHRGDGEFVNEGDIILTIETDKISTELETDRAGTLKHSASEGDELEIGAVVATIEAGEAPSPPSGGEGEVDGSSEVADGDGPTSGEKGESHSEGSENGSVKATPVARKMAEEAGLSLDEIEGSGVGGKVTKADVIKLSEAPSVPTQPAAPKKTSTVSAVSKSGDRTTRRKMSPLRRKIATHLVNAQQGAALLTTFNEVDMSAIMSLRKRVQDDFVKRHDVKLGFMSFFIKAVVDALRAIPAINAQIDGEEIVENHFYDIGVAVGTDKGLMVPVIRDCEEKSFAEIEKDIVEYAGKAREGSIELGDLQGGVFTITNGGIYGSMLSTPILNPPQSGILGMHSIQQRPVAVDGEVVIRPMMYLALTYDHRLVDGKEAVTFLVRVKECLENPDRMLVGA